MSGWCCVYTIRFNSDRPSVLHIQLIKYIYLIIHTINSINQLVFETHTQCVYYEVGTEFCRLFARLGIPAHFEIAASAL